MVLLLMLPRVLPLMLTLPRVLLLVLTLPRVLLLVLPRVLIRRRSFNLQLIEWEIWLSIWQMI